MGTNPSREFIIPSNKTSVYKIQYIKMRASNDNLKVLVKHGNQLFVVNSNSVSDKSRIVGIVEKKIH
jgi:hypothetical protein